MLRGKNGTIYNQHKYINKVRRYVAALEFGDLDVAYGFFDEGARFSNLDTPSGKTHSLEEDRAGHEDFRQKFEISSIDQRGYPDLMKYELDNAKVVYSWWDFRVVRKSDKKKINIPVMLSHRFNDDGKIIHEYAYFSSKLLD